MTFQGTLGWLDKELAKLEEKAAKLRSARAVLAEYAPVAEVAQVAKKPRLAPRAAKPKAQPAPPAVTFDRRASIAAAAAKVAPKKAAMTVRADGKPMPGMADWKCKGCGGRGHSARSKSCPKKSAEPAPADFVERVLAAPAPPVVAAREATVLRLSAKTGRPVKSRALGERLFRCSHPVIEEHGTLKKTRQCGETVWDADRQKHLHREHDLLTEVWGGYFEQLKDPEDVDAEDAAA
jgi:hypothetical protein